MAKTGLFNTVKNITENRLQGRGEKGSDSEIQIHKRQLSV